MLSTLFNGSTLPLLERAAAFAERRQEVLAGNLTNFSTPDYQPQDLPVAEFQHALQQAVREHSVETAEGEARWSFGPGVHSDDIEQQLYRAEMFRPQPRAPVHLTFHDGQARSPEFEAMQMTKNALLHSAVTEMLAAQLNRLQAVISERP